MEKFSKTKRDKTDKELYKDDYIALKEYEGWTILEESDSVVCIPFLIETNEFIIREEFIPSYKKSSGGDMHVVCVSGTVEDNEDISDALKRELEEEVGFILSDNYKFDFETIFKWKTSSSKYHLAIVPLTIYDYGETFAKGDGSEAEKRSKSIRVNIKYLNMIRPADTITSLLIYKLKSYLNL